MYKLYGHLQTSLTVLLIVVLALLVGSCITTEREGFAIYLTKQDIPPAQMEALSHIDIAYEPVISEKDVVAYDAQTHELELTTKGFNRISSLEVPVRGRSFVVCVDRQPIYWGAFWTPISSVSFDGVTIWKPLGSEESSVITLELGYPSASFHSGQDPRNSREVMGSLEQAGKLINQASPLAKDPLSHSFKGYEMYSWMEDGKWHFTLITGTNRTKATVEITSEEDVISETGWVKIHAECVDAIKGVLGRLPQNESVIWCGELHIGQTAETDFLLPPEEITDLIQEYAKQSGLDFAITVY